MTISIRNVCSHTAQEFNKIKMSVCKVNMNIIES